MTTPKPGDRLAKITAADVLAVIQKRVDEYEALGAPLAPEVTVENLGGGRVRATFCGLQLPEDPLRETLWSTGRVVDDPKWEGGKRGNVDLACGHTVSVSPGRVTGELERPAKTPCEECGPHGGGLQADSESWFRALRRAFPAQPARLGGFDNARGAPDGTCIVSHDGETWYPAEGQALADTATLWPSTEELLKR